MGYISRSIPVVVLFIISVYCTKAHAYEYSHETINETMALTYYVALPDDYDYTKTYPLIVFLHDYGEDAVTFRDKVTTAIGDIDAILLFPRAPWPVQPHAKYPGFGWNTRYYLEAPDYPGQYQLDPSFSLIEDSVVEAMKNHNIDRNNVFLVGEGQGGAHALQLAVTMELFTGFCSINFPFAHKCQWLGIHERKAPLLILNTIDEFRIPTPECSATDAFSGLQFTDATYRSYPRASYVVTPEELEDLREWLLAHLSSENQTPVRNLLHTLESPVSTDQSKILALSNLAHASVNDTEDTDFAILHKMLNDPTTDSKVLLWTIYAVGALRLTGFESELGMIAKSSDLPNGRREPSPLLIDDERYSTTTTGWHGPIFFIDPSTERRFWTNGTRVASLRALRKIKTDAACKLLDEIDTTIIASRGQSGYWDDTLLPFQGDILLEIDGEKITSVESYVELSRKHGRSDCFNAKVMSFGKERLIEIKNVFLVSNFEEYVLPVT